ncbi:dipeptide ABC transporter ATP-binding protein [Bifidobacterium crudilactis]|jgi:ABC-type glutathione transport system ATPase component|uniref:dipeptide ABC transporter ATP-binding protein n=1 Tax=Bifidobacterium crudilactis TaxID=327277 RepID=UPI0023570C33|nr:ABC transporter ATP-binding protein [Bifidobacterium crudilactis]MCI1218460.1 ABC transporter ATP-binding protein [Bifidobacterium crudilactis]
MTDGTATAAQQSSSDVVLNISGLRVSSGDKEIIHGIDITVRAGERLGLIGESGSGKSLTCLAAMGLLPQGLTATGSIELPSAGIDVLHADDQQMRTLRGSTMSMVFQEPMTALNPLMKVGRQVGEVVSIHTPKASGAEIGSRVDDMLTSVGLADVKRVSDSYPFQLSGGQRQRVMLAMAMINSPGLLLADEPTTALDVTVQKQVTELMSEQVRSSGSSLLFITHDLGVVAGLCNSVAIMRHGRIIERGALEEVFAHPRHPYTKALLAASKLEKDGHSNRLVTLADLERREHDDRMQGQEGQPAVTTKGPEPAAMAPHDVLPEEPHGTLVFNRYESSLAHPHEEAIQVSELVKSYKTRSLGSTRTFKAVNGISFDVHKGEKFGIVGESGCGKSTTLRMLSALDRATSGSIKIFGTEIVEQSARGNAWVHQKVQVVFQDPMGSLDPRMRIWQIVSEPLGKTPRKERLARAERILESVGLDAASAQRYPHQFSGGQRQRIAIARALITKPQVLIADEAVSALDVSVRAQVLNLLADLSESHAFTLVFVSHDLHVVRNQCDVVAVMRKGEIVECGPSEEIYKNPLHPYTKTLLEAMPDIGAAGE